MKIFRVLFICIHLFFITIVSLCADRQDTVYVLLDKSLENVKLVNAKVTDTTGQIFYHFAYSEKILRNLSFVHYFRSKDAVEAGYCCELHIYVKDESFLNEIEYYDIHDLEQMTFNELSNTFDLPPEELVIFIIDRENVPERKIRLLQVVASMSYGE